MNDNAYSGANEAELGFLKEIVRMLPAGLTVQDAQGKLLLVNDVAAAQLGMDGSRPSPDLTQRREACERALRAGQPVVFEEALQDGPARQVLLTTHRPVQLAGRELLISASADITEQKNFEDQLFRSAYFDELTGLPSRRVIEHRANSLLGRDRSSERFALAFDARVQHAQRCDQQALYRRAMGFVEQGLRCVAPFFVPREQLHQRVRAVDHVARIVEERGPPSLLVVEPVNGVPCERLELRACALRGT